MKIGVLALQGDFREHMDILKRLGVEPVKVRTKKDLKDVKGLIIPGGESTTIGNLLVKNGLKIELEKKNKKNFPIFGSCAGAILLSKKIKGSTQPHLNFIDVEIKRNAYGRQQESFETTLEVFDKPFHSIFIRSPRIESTGKKVEILAEYNSSPVLARQKNILICTFHPELTDDTRIHELFLQMCSQHQ
ncbi:pyridoxal 5'-phosphate synthase glutaminase subunit PdxT [Candidatus Woesearchaeota archaeon]|nr:pyridoxal 5'-phosphate synthase glutaminase subunit PdxT [Candidatus Woesearchaeota archaeon]